MGLRFAVEAWTWYAIAWIVFGLRLVSRKLLQKNMALRIDDYIAIFAMGTYTAAISCLYLFDKINSSLDYDNLTHEEAVFYGRKLGIVNVIAETNIQTTLWSIKACLLILYYGISVHTKHNIALRIIALYTGLCYPTIMILFFYGWCRPFSQYLVLVPEVEECLTWKHYNIVQLTLNLSTDVAIICVPISLIGKTKMKLSKKVMLSCTFGLGIFIITACLFTKSSVFMTPDQPVWLPWSVREVSTTVLVGNLISCVPVFCVVWGYFSTKAQSVLTKWKGSERSSYQDMEKGEVEKEIELASTTHLPPNMASNE